MKKSLNLLILSVVLLFTLQSKAALFRFLPYTVENPDKTVINCFVSGDEFFNYLHDSQGFTIIQGNDGFYYYAVSDGIEVKASQYRVNSVNPEQVGLKRWALISPEAYKARRSKWFEHPRKSTKTAHTGVIQNIVIYIRFSDQSEFTIPRSTYDEKYNKKPGKSLKTYYEEVSYNKLTIESTHYPLCSPDVNLSYQDPNPRSYYEPYNATTNPNGYQPNQRNQREQTLLKNAVNYVKSQIPANLNIDSDNDGYVDNVCFVIRGNSGAWADLLWAHRYWWVYGTPPTINGKMVNDYTFQPENQNDVQTLCHEMFHSLGAPDLYHYSYDGFTTAGEWDLMESGSNHMSAYMKWKYANQAWIENIPEITQSGVYTLRPLLNATNNCYLLRTNASPTEFFVLEYRRRTAGTFEDDLPGSGLLIWRIDPSAGDGNASGPPDEVWVIRPNTTSPSTNGSVGLAHLSAQTGRTVVNNFSNPTAFLQDGTPANLDIWNVTEADSTISFTVGINAPPHANFKASSTNIIVDSYVSFTDLSSGNPTAWNWSFPGGNPSSYTGRTPPPIQYNTPGTYSVSLSIVNPFGDDQIVKTDYIKVNPNFIDCSNAIPLNCNQTITDSTIGLASNSRKYNCTSDKFYGPEKVYAVSLNAPSNISLELSQESNSNLFLLLFDGCSTTNCLKVHSSYINQNTLDAGTYYIVVDGYNGAEGSYQLTVSCSPLGIDENIASNDRFYVFPNPADDVVSIVVPKSFSSSAVQVKLYSATGSLLWNSVNPLIDDKNTISLNVRNFADGIYWVELLNAEKRFSTKLSIFRK